MHDTNAAGLKDDLIAVARRAGAVILDVYGRDFQAEQKSDRWPVTEADTAAEALIVSELARLAPDVPVIAEEQAASGGLPAEAAHRFFLVDPLVGTKEVIATNGAFNANIALIEGGRLFLGVVDLPAFDVC